MQHIREIMSTISQQIVSQATKEGKIPPPFLKLGEKQPQGGVKSTGAHQVKFLADKEEVGTDVITGQERAEVRYLFEENGQKKRYSVAKYKKDPQTKQYTDEINYFVVRMSEVEVGEEIILEMKRQGNRNYIDFKRTLEPTGKVSDEEIPVIEEPVIKKVAPTTEGGEVEF